MSAICICDRCGSRIETDQQKARFVVPGIGGRPGLLVEMKPANGSFDICLGCAIDGFQKLIKPQEQAA